MRTAIIFGANLLLGAGALAWVLVQHGAPALALLGREPRPLRVCAFVVLAAGIITLHAIRWRFLLAALGTRWPLGWLTAYRAAAQSVSSLIPSAKLGGEPLRAFFLVREGVAGARAIASVAVDRTLEVSAAAPFACLYTLILLRRGVPGLEGALVTVLLGAAALALGVAVAVRRLRRRSGLVTAVARSTGLDRLPFVREHMDVLDGAEEEAARLIAGQGTTPRAFAIGLAANLLVIVEYHVLLTAFGLPADLVAVVAAVFATGAAHSLPVPAAVGVLEGAQMFVFQALGHSPEVGLAVGLAVRLRELVWILPGLVYLLGRALARAKARYASSGRRPQMAAAKKPG